MNYPIKPWVVIIHTPSNEHIHIFKTRHLAYDLFEQVKNLIKEAYPNAHVMSHNEEGYKGNAYYGILEAPISVRLIGNSFEGYFEHVIKQVKEEIKEDLYYEI